MYVCMYLCPVVRYRSFSIKYIHTYFCALRMRALAVSGTRWCGAVQVVTPLSTFTLVLKAVVQMFKHK